MCEISLNIFPSSVFCFFCHSNVLLNEIIGLPNTFGEYDETPEMMAGILEVHKIE